jgi:hypothetical protein
MKKHFVFGLLLLIAASAAGAQGATTPHSGDLGVGASVSSSSNTALVFYHMTDSLMLAAQGGLFHNNYADTSAGTTANFPGTWWDIGLGIYYVVQPFEQLSLQVGPSVEFATEKYKNDGNTDNLQFTYWQAQLNLRVLAMITKNLGVFTTFGVYYYSNDNKNTTSSVETLKTGFGTQSLSLGVAFYFK